MESTPRKPAPAAVPTPQAMLGSLLWCLVTTVATAIVHGLWLLVPHRLRGRKTVADLLAPHTEYYEGRVQHTRLRPVAHKFQYEVRYELIDLDRATVEDRLTADQARAETGCKGRVRLLRLPPSAGYEENPIAVYYCYDGEDKLACCLAEVTNTPWADRVRFAFDPAGDTVPKPMHVSPLQDMDGAWVLHATTPGERLRVSVGCKHPALGDFFHALLEARRVPPVADPARWAFAMPHRVAAWIYWHAALLLWRGLPFIGHPKSESGPSAFKTRALSRAREAGRMRCPAAPKDAGQPQEGGCPYVWHDQTAHPWN
jgi:DUF1365 family protein